MIKQIIKSIIDPKKVALQKFEANYLQPLDGTRPAYTSPVIMGQEGNDLFYKIVAEGKPLMATRFGNVELRVIMNYLNLARKKKTYWHPHVMTYIFRLNHLFPPTNQSLEKFAQLYLEEIKGIDVLGAWYNKGEEELQARYFPSATILDLLCYESFFFNHPWSRILENKKVLVIHPYSASIEKQYKERRNLLFANNEVLPVFDLQTCKPFNSYTDNITPGRSWFDELDIMKAGIGKYEFDIALIAAGPFGLPLAGHVKRMGKQAIHIGGALQLFFGIKGQRWESMEQGKFFNEQWVRPSSNEMPQADIRKKVDDNSYW